MKKITSAIFFITMCFAAHSFAATVGGELKVWHKVTVTFDGPTCSETGTPNPFRNYRLDVTFTGPSSQTFKVPGYFAADGNAAETSATSGNKWRVNFCPDEAGLWQYSASFVTGTDIAAELTGGTAAGYFNGETGQFAVSASDKTGADLRGKGKLEYVGEHYLQFRNGEYFLKVGANSPEVFLEYQDFDGTNSTRTYSNHVGDWQSGDPVWKSTKGKGIIGVVNYLAGVGVNAHYFLTMNTEGDGKKAYPWTGEKNIWNYDCSKLDQWEIVFGQFDRKGMMLHFVLTECENQSLFEDLDSSAPIGGFAKSRKIYYREMVARFGHHLAVTWNVGEENGWDRVSQYGTDATANTTHQRKDFANRLRALTYYDDHISVHNGPSGDDGIFNGILGYPTYTGPSIQWNIGSNVHEKVLNWRNASITAGHKWVVSLDEAYSSGVPSNDDGRKKTLWGSLMAGGAGAEHYIGGQDLAIQNYRTYATLWTQMGYAQAFFTQYVPFWEMQPDDNLIAGSSNWCLKKNGLYLFYLSSGGNQSVTLPAGTYSVNWFDPRNGGSLIPGGTITGGGTVSLGSPPSNPTLDWAALVSLGPSAYGPRLEYTPVTLSGGLTGWMFYLANDDGLLTSYTVEMAFEGEEGAAIRQQRFMDLIDVHSEANATDWDGLGEPPYSKTLDSWIFSPFAENPIAGTHPLTGVPLNGIVEAPNVYAMSCYSGPGSQLGDGVNLAYIVADGNVRWTGTIRRSGVAYSSEGVTEGAVVLIAGDYNGDGYVDLADYTVWADHYGQSGSDLPGDGNGDGVVDLADYTVWADHFGQGTPPAN